jgi:hypothetical protein
MVAMCKANRGLYPIGGNTIQHAPQLLSAHAADAPTPVPSLTPPLETVNRLLKTYLLYLLATVTLE